MFPVSDFDKYLNDLDEKKIAKTKVLNITLGLRDVQKWMKCVLCQEISKIPVDLDEKANVYSHRMVCSISRCCANRVKAAHDSKSSSRHFDGLNVENRRFDHLDTDDEILCNRGSSGDTVMKVTAVEKSSMPHSLVNSMNDSAVLTLPSDWKLLCAAQNEHIGSTADESVGHNCLLLSCWQSETCCGNAPSIGT
jgi:hypothetical protein